MAKRITINKLILTFLIVFQMGLVLQAQEQTKTDEKIILTVDSAVDYAVKKGTPVIESAAKEVKESTIKALESITAKLKEEEPKKSNKKTTKTSK